MGELLGDTPQFTISEHDVVGLYLGDGFAFSVEIVDAGHRHRLLNVPKLKQVHQGASHHRRENNKPAEATLQDAAHSVSNTVWPLCHLLSHCKSHFQSVVRK